MQIPETRRFHSPVAIRQPPTVEIGRTVFTLLYSDAHRMIWPDFRDGLSILILLCESVRRRYTCGQLASYRQLKAEGKQVLLARRTIDTGPPASSTSNSDMGFYTIACSNPLLAINIGMPPQPPSRLLAAKWRNTL